MPNAPWYLSLPPCEAAVPCGAGTHQVRWEADALHLPAHPDAEAELVLAALGGEKAGCVELAATWSQHAADLAVLTYGPRGPADQVKVTWDDVATVTGEHPGGGPGQAGSYAALASATSALVASMHSRRPRGPRDTRMQAAIDEQRRRLSGRYTLLALGYPFQLRLAGHAVAAHAERLAAQDRPLLTAAMAGRLAPAAEDWIGIDPDQVEAGLGDDLTAVLTGKGAQRRLRFTLPPDWLASVWACGLALVGRYLVVAVPRPGWPDAQVLALRSPSAEPELIDVHGTGDAPHWEI